MKKNMGRTDTRMRVIAAFIIVLLYAFRMVPGMFAIVLLALAAVLLVTGLFRYCPLYRLLGISTRKNGRQKMS